MIDALDHHPEMPPAISHWVSVLTTVGKENGTENELWQQDMDDSVHYHFYCVQTLRT